MRLPMAKLHVIDKIIRQFVVSKAYVKNSEMWARGWVPTRDVTSSDEALNALPEQKIR